MFENIAAIDIGTYSIKVVLIKTGLKDFEVKSFIYENISYNIENYSDALNEALKKIASEEDLSNYRILTNLPMEKAIIRNVNFPFNDVKKIADAIPYEAEDNIPFNIDDLVLDFQPLKSENKDEGRVLLAAAGKDTVLDFIKILNEQNLIPIKMGMESTSLFESYRYFNKIQQETVIQLHIGNKKTIINLIKDNSLIYTRAISAGICMIHKSIADIMKFSLQESITLFEGLDIDLNSLNSNIHKGAYKTLKVNKDKFKKIYDESIRIFNELIEQIILTIQSYTVSGVELNFDRVLISGGGSNIEGIGVILSKNLELPVIALPFIDYNNEISVRSQFHIAFGMFLSHINRKSYAINFLKGEFIPDISRSTKKIYYLSAFFCGLSVLIFLLNAVISSALVSSTNNKYNDILSDKFKKYFNTKKITDDPIVEANKIIKKEKSELDNITSLVSANNSIMDLLLDILNNFSPDEYFEMKDLVINESIIKIDGIIGSGKAIDDFKEKLIKSNKYDTVSLNIKFSKKNEVRFTMTIKLKTEIPREKGNKNDKLD